MSRDAFARSGLANPAFDNKNSTNHRKMEVGVCLCLVTQYYYSAVLMFARVGFVQRHMK